MNTHLEDMQHNLNGRHPTHKQVVEMRTCLEKLITAYVHRGDFFAMQHSKVSCNATLKGNGGAASKQPQSKKKGKTCPGGIGRGGEVVQCIVLADQAELDYKKALHMASSAQLGQGQTQALMSLGFLFASKQNSHNVCNLGSNHMDILSVDASINFFEAALKIDVEAMPVEQIEGDCMDNIERNATVVMVSHDEEQLKRFCSSIVRLS